MNHIPEPPAISFWEASPLFRALIRRKLDDDAWAWAEPRLIAMGQRAAFEVAPLAAIADRESPRLVTHDARGNRIDRVDYHPSYREMERIAYGSGLIGMKYSHHPPQPDAPLGGLALRYHFA